MAGRGVRTPANTGKRANIDIGPMISAAGGGGELKGGPSVVPQQGPVQEGQAPLPPLVNNQPYSVKHPILDALFNHGAGQAQANTANLNMSMGAADRASTFANNVALQQNQQAFQTSDRAQGHTNALALQLAQQNFELRKDAINNDATLDRDEKLAETAKAAAILAQHNAVLTSANVLSTPESEADYINAVNPTMIQAAADKGAESSTASRVGATKNFATLDAMQANYPAMVASQGNQIQTGRIASEGALKQQPVVNANTALANELQPPMLVNEAMKTRFMPTVSGLFDLGSGKVSIASPAAQKQADQSAFQKVLMNQAGGGANTPPATVGGFQGGIPLNPPAITPAATTSGTGTQPDGSVIIGDTIYYRDGTRKKVGTP